MLTEGNKKDLGLTTGCSRVRLMLTPPVTEGGAFHSLTEDKVEPARVDEYCTSQMLSISMSVFFV